MKYEIFGKGLLVERVYTTGLVCDDKTYYTIKGLSPDDYEEAGIRPGVRLKGFIFENESDNGDTYFSIIGWKVAGPEAAKEPEAVKEIKRKNKKSAPEEARELHTS
jgi:hypothetical protein